MLEGTVADVLLQAEGSTRSSSIIQMDTTNILL